jgi:two-component system chemotaxis response regulator CheB
VDGLEFLKRQMALSPLPVVVVSTASGQHELVLRALEAGAVDFVHKPSQLASASIFEVTDELIEKVKTAATIQLHRIEVKPLEPPPEAIPAAIHGTGSVDAIVIGISTGGPQGLKYLIPRAG